MRKEYAQARVLALAQRGVLYALDEINMATTRLQLWYPGEDSHGELEKLFKLHPEEVPQRNVQLTGEKFMALDDFMRAKGQLRYLKVQQLRERLCENSILHLCRSWVFFSVVVY
jgi:E3 ubiquitin-protein ligase SHPRH